MEYQPSQTDHVWASHSQHFFKHCSSITHRAHPSGIAPHRSQAALLPHCGPFSMGCISGLGLLLWKLSRGCVSFRPHSLPHCGLLCGWTGSTKFQVVPMCYGGTFCSFMGCREHLLSTWSTSCPPSALTLVATCSFTHIFSLYPSCCRAAVFIKYAPTVAQPVLFTGSALAAAGSYWSELDQAVS